MARETRRESVRISQQAHYNLHVLCKESGPAKQVILDRAVEAYCRQNILEGLNADYSVLRENADEWSDEVNERRIWEQAIADGIDS
jgi:hypothetical protein